MSRLDATAAARRGDRRLRLITGVAAHDLHHASPPHLLTKRYSRRYAGR